MIIKKGGGEKGIEPKVVGDIHFNECMSNVKKVLMFPFGDFILQ